MTIENTAKFDYSNSYTVSILHDTDELFTMVMFPHDCCIDEVAWNELTYYDQFDALHTTAVKVFNEYLSVSISR